MKLDPDCIRDILFVVEDKTGYQVYTSAYEVAESINKYPHDVVMYHIDQCEMYGFFTKVQHYQNGDDDSTIYDLSPKGHEFIRNIRSDNVWNKIKENAKTFGGFSISILGELAKSIITSKLKF